MSTDELQDPRPQAADHIHAPVPYSSAWVVLLLIMDLSAFTLSSRLAMMTVARFWDPRLALSHIIMTTVITITVWFLLFLRLGLYRRSFALSMRDELYYTITALCLGVLPLLTAFTLIPSISSSRIVILFSLIYSTATVGTSRALLNSLRDRLDRRRHKRIAIVGNPARVKAATEALNIADSRNVLTIEIDDIDATLAPLISTPGTEAQDISWLRLAYTWHCERLILTEMPQPNILPYLLEATARLQFELAIAPPRIRAQAYALTLQTQGQQVLIVPRRLPACLPSARLFKRIVDLIVATTALLIFSPIMLLTALAVFLDSGGPVFYRQERVGRDGKSFHIYKFRSMRVNAETHSGPVWRDINDSRTTRVGNVLRRTSLDELPQLFNVFHGDMSVVGPRPERPFFVERFRKHLPRYDERHLVRPGITGWAQIHLNRNNDLTKIGEKLSHDLFYIEHWSLFMDLSIIVKTAAEVFFHRAS